MNNNSMKTIQSHNKRRKKYLWLKINNETK
jgi:hypothetical protein